MTISEVEQDIFLNFNYFHFYVLLIHHSLTNYPFLEILKILKCNLDIMKVTIKSHESIKQN